MLTAPSVLSQAKLALLNGLDADFRRIVTPVTKQAVDTKTPLCPSMERLMCAYILKQNGLIKPDEIREFLECIP